MFQFLLVVHAIIAAALVAVILMQQSEGGGLAGGGSPAGLMSARGASNFLTRTTTVLATIFVLLSIGMAALASVNRDGAEIDTSLAKKPGVTTSAPAVAPAEQPIVPLAGEASNTATVALPAPQPLPDAAAKSAAAPAVQAAPTVQKSEKPAALPPAPKAEAPKVKVAPAPRPAPVANTTAPIAVPPTLVSPPTQPVERPEPQPEGR